MENLNQIELQPIRYATYTDDGALDGCYIQVPPEAHAACMIVVDETVAAAWPAYRANEARDGVELAPVTIPPVPVVPQQVTNRQAKLALLGAGKLADVDTAIASMPSPQKEAAQIEWTYAGTFDRTSPLVLTLGPLLDLDDAALDELFTTASIL